jgi:plastocyanin
MKHRLALLALCVKGIFAINVADAAVVNVGGGSNSFSPQQITINVGEAVTFVNKGGFHNVVADDGSYRCARGCDGDGKGGSGNASSSSWVVTVTFNSAGSFGYFCEIHGMPGVDMFGTIVVQGAPPPPPPPASADPIPALGANVLALLIGAIVLSTLIVMSLVRRRSRQRT